MAKSLADLQKELSFVSGPVESLYLNETRVHDCFIGQLGAISSFTKTATKEAGFETPVIKLSGGLSNQSDVTWNLERQPIAQALVLRSALASQGQLYGPDCTTLGSYISFAGIAHISRPDAFDGDQQDWLWRQEQRPELYSKLEAERARIEGNSRIMEGPEVDLWLLTLSEGKSICAATLDKRWLQSAAHHWVGLNYRWEIFGILRDIQKTGVPFLVALDVHLSWRGNAH
jgi:hypothetical protein